MWLECSVCDEWVEDSDANFKPGDRCFHYPQDCNGVLQIVESPHCPSCGIAAEAFGTECVCPCHTWAGRRCECGGFKDLINYTVADGKLTVHEAWCLGCGTGVPGEVN